MSSKRVRLSGSSRPLPGAFRAVGSAPRSEPYRHLRREWLQVAKLQHLTPGPQLNMASMARAPSLLGSMSSSTSYSRAGSKSGYFQVELILCGCCQPNSFLLVSTFAVLGPYFVKASLVSQGALYKIERPTATFG